MLNLLLPNIIIFNFLLCNTNASHMDKNNSDTIVTYSGHSEAGPNANLPKETPLEKDLKTAQVQISTEANADVLFIPNHKPVFRNDDEYSQADVKLGDVMTKQRIGDIIRDEQLVTEAAKADILFISGKNNENIGKPKQKRQKDKHEDAYKNTKTKRPKSEKMDCSRLECNNTVLSVCGGKIEHNKWRHRLFLNECFFRKVNCGFKYPNNRYQLVPTDKCKDIGTHSSLRPPMYHPLPDSSYVNQDLRRSFSSRRSLNMYLNGQGCSHPCPTACTEDYDPQCVLSPTGHKKVFLNHCKLDYNSCFYRVVWHKRPLSECVGGKKADMRQNRGFISWMQKVGIVDNRGRLVLS